MSQIKHKKYGWGNRVAPQLGNFTGGNMTRSAYPVEECFNCGEKIGRMESASVRDGKIICPDCDGKISTKTSPVRKILNIIVILALLGGAIAFATGYITENYEVGGLGIFAAAGAVVFQIARWGFRLIKR
jgi:hypothetical protein